MDIRDLDRRALDGLREIVTALRDADMAAPTPCAGWTVRDLIEHMNTEHEAISTLILDEPVTLDTDPRRAFGQAVDRWLAAFATDGMPDIDIYLPMLGSRWPADQVLSVHFADMLTHRWDLTTALGRDPELPADLLELALPIATAIPTTGPLRGPIYGAPVPITDTASATDQLVAALGRSPAWTQGRVDQP
ncbi:uncharacterized protein (TIGR03086 family) [Herbihabitans rhizosphaerae]|uniref:Uncharacterized protein (TIGR03086 family) n=1 Tax=Herbihabitans rhizosphaerae TaxID=1872711 RepID=A0A4Q7L3F3_9PSEU|nr:TIGR03086 family metal-binding protein [Herbihabitans rhizosphaerae]RZS44128.1 uncharacterized protein (TIGR03086 family) [Herbihabitans rhizosphaerae]